MMSTDAYQLDEVNKNLAVGYQREYAEDGTKRFKNNIFLHVIKGGPAGGGYSTVEDLLNFDRALRAHKLLGPGMTDVVLSGKIETGRGSDDKYAYGFEDKLVYGRRFVGHGGGFPGISSQLDMDLTGGYTIVVLSNYDG